MQHLPFEDPGRQASSKQSIKVSESDLSNSPIGHAEGNVNQASRDIINYFINSAQGDLYDDKIEKIKKFEESLQIEFKEKIAKAALLVNDLRTCIEHRLTDGSPKDDATILRLLDELQSNLGKESRLKLIDEDLEFCLEGGVWLHKNKHRLARCAKDCVFQQEGVSELLGNATSKLAFRELEERFLQDLEMYIGWISVHLKTGTTPQTRDFKDGIFRVHLDLPESAYKSAFKALNSDFVDPVVSNLSTGAANNTASYFNRFIIDRDLSKDAKVSVTKKLPKTLSLSKVLSNSIFLSLLMVIVIVVILILR